MPEFGDVLAQLHGKSCHTAREPPEGRRSKSAIDSLEAFVRDGAGGARMAGMEQVTGHSRDVPQCIQEAPAHTDMPPSRRPPAGRLGDPHPHPPSQFRLKTTLPVAAEDLGSKSADSTAGGCGDDPECSLNQLKVLLLGICDVGDGILKVIFCTPHFSLSSLFHVGV